MMRSMFCGVSGLTNHQLMMDVIGNNIANINTIGFKSSMVTFQDALSQTLRGATRATDETGGTNPIQAGLGVKLASVNTNFSQGSLLSTGNMTDLSIQGNGFFVVSDGSSSFYTRAGSFGIDSVGKLVNTSNGYVVQGWMADAAGDIDTSDVTTSITIPVGQTMNPRETERIDYKGNLPSDAAVGATYTTSIDVFDSLGTAHTITVTFEKTAANQWTWTASGPAGLAGNTGNVVFDAEGRVSSTTGGPITFTPAGADALSITPNFGTVGTANGLTQYAGNSSAAATYQNGYAAGTLQSFSVSDAGVITGVFSNGMNMQLAQLSLATFNNPGGLMKMGDNLYAVSNNSGEPLVGESGSGGRGNITAGTLEMSNVDLAKEFTWMIIAQRGFQANAKTITAADDMLQDLVHLKR